MFGSNFFDKFVRKSKELKYWNNFDKQAWDGIGYPWRPANEEIKAIKKILDTCEVDSRIALLGCTPEIRELISKKNIRFDVVDISKKMYDEMGSICRTSSGEKFINSDWIRYFSKKQNYYDLIIGDLIERLLPTNRLIMLSEILNNSLKSGGSVLLRSDYYSKKIKNENLDVIAAMRVLMKKKLSDKEITDWLFFGVSSNFSNFLDKVELAKIIILFKKVQKHIKEGSRENKIIEMCLNRWQFPLLDFYCRSVEKIESIWGRYFIANDKIEKRLFKGRFIAIRRWQRK